MKKITLLLTLAAGIAFNTTGLAESFNERGEDFVASVQPGTSVTSQPKAITHHGFNERGGHFITEASAGSKSANSGIHITVTGFNDRSFNSVN